MTLRAWPLDGIGEIKPGDDLAEVVVNHLTDPLADGDVVVITSKVVSKAAGLATVGDRDTLLDAETDRVVAQRGQTRIIRTHSGLTLAAAGIDASNLEPGMVIPLPRDPDKHAREIRTRLEEITGVRIAVIITDTAGRAWRIGQTDIAIGASGIAPSLSFEGVEDPYGNVLAVTSPAIADEIAGAAELVSGKLGGQPVVVVRGLPIEWFGDHDEGAASLIREDSGDMFGLGARDAALLAAGHDEDTRGFPMLDDGHGLLALACEGVDLSLTDASVVGDVIEVRAKSVEPAAYVAAGMLAERLRILARALGQDVTINVAP